MKVFRSSVHCLRKVYNHLQRPCYNFLEKDKFPFLDGGWPTQSRIMQEPLSVEGICDLKNINEFVDKTRTHEQDKLTLGPRKEFLIVGRSNVGKSSLINALTMQDAASISNYPGKTRHLYFYKIGLTGLVLVDAPGYGFAKGDQKDLVNWGKMILKYLEQSPYLYRTVCLVDGEHGFKETDFMIFDLLEKKNKPFMVCLTKCDKVTGKQFENLLETTAAKIKHYNFCSPIINASSTKSGYGISELRSHIYYLLNVQSL